MRLFPVGCRAAEQKMADLFTGELHVRERLELEAHADTCARCDSMRAAVATAWRYVPATASTTSSRASFAESIAARSSSLVVFQFLRATGS